MSGGSSGPGSRTGFNLFARFNAASARATRSLPVKAILNPLRRERIKQRVIAQVFDLMPAQSRS
jgi:hypothetical protein